MSSACRILDFLPLYDNSMLGYNKQKIITFLFSFIYWNILWKK